MIVWRSIHNIDYGRNWSPTLFSCPSVCVLVGFTFSWKYRNKNCQSGKSLKELWNWNKTVNHCNREAHCGAHPKAKPQKKTSEPLRTILENPKTIQLSHCNDFILHIFFSTKHFFAFSTLLPSSHFQLLLEDLFYFHFFAKVCFDSLFFSIWLLFWLVRFTSKLSPICTRTNWYEKILEVTYREVDWTFQEQTNSPMLFLEK